MIQFLLPFFLVVTAFSLVASPVDDEIARLEAKLKEYRKKEMNSEITSQKDMLLDWQDYTHELKNAEDSEHEIEKIQKRLDELRSQKESQH